MRAGAMTATRGREPFAGTRSRRILPLGHGDDDRDGECTIGRVPCCFNRGQSQIPDDTEDTFALKRQIAT